MLIRWGWAGNGCSLILASLLPKGDRWRTTLQGFGQGHVLDNMKAASASMKAFYKDHGSMPSSQADFDIILQSLYSEELSGSRNQTSTNGA